MSIYANRAIGIDISHYQVEVDWDKCDADYVIIKAGEGTTPDPMCASHVAGAAKAGIAIGLYWFHDPAMFQQAGFDLNDKSRWWPAEKDPQLQALIKTCSTKTFHMLAFDHERWWLDYGEYFEYMRGQRPIEQVRRVTSAWNSESAKIEMGRIRDWLVKAYPSQTTSTGTSKLQMLYSARWFLESHTPASKAWVDTYDQWVAEYPYGPGAVAIQNIAEYRAKHLPTDTQKPGWLVNRQWMLWQASGDKFTVPWVRGGTGKPSAIDINISYLPREQFFAAIGFTPTTPPPEPPTDPEPPEEPEDPATPPASGTWERIAAALERIAAAEEARNKGTWTVTGKMG